MIDLSGIKESFVKPVAIFGLGKSCMATARALDEAGVKLILWDDSEEQRDAARKDGFIVRDLMQEDFLEISLLVLAPGIHLKYPEPHPVVKRAQQAGTEVICDIELLGRAKPDIHSIGITGTNGKSTTTALIAHIFDESDIEVECGGNIGIPALELDDISSDGVYVLELSSYQLDLCPDYAPEIAVLLNITPDHLDHHGEMESYVAAKEKIFRGHGIAIIAVDDEETKKIYQKLERESDRNVIPVSCREVLDGGVYVNDNCILIDNIKGENRPVVDLKELKNLRGRHNWQNAAAAYAACKSYGMSLADIAEDIKTFDGLAHRQQLIATQNGVSYINDSKATNVESTCKALQSYSNIYWIAGGKVKEGGFEGLSPYLAQVQHVYLIGEDSSELESFLKEKNVPYTVSITLDNAVRSAHDGAKESEIANPIVLFSPACASFDQFNNFEERGEAFAGFVQSVLEEEPFA